MGTFRGTGGEHSEAEVGLGGPVLRLASLSSKAHCEGVPDRDKTCSGSSSTTSSNFVSTAGGVAFEGVGIFVIFRGFFICIGTTTGIVLTDWL